METIETRYEQIKNMKKENPEKAQKIMLELAEKYIDVDLGKLWGVPMHKVSKLRRQLGIEKNSAGEVKQVFPPNTYTPEEGFTNGREIKPKEEQEKQYFDRRKSDKQKKIDLQAHGLTKDQLEKLLSIIDLSDGVVYNLSIEVTPQKQTGEKNDRQVV